ncbi:MAG: DUF4838 domain-containing protein [Planctomycetes bacterium]|jgi:hypothetical protein|nr:DUF4838 domain-containing protein [Planctomycetota bacterium]
MMSTRLAWTVLAVLAVLAVSARSQEIDLVRDGRAVAVLVVDEAAAPSQGKGRPAKGRSGFACSDLTAAGVLADWIEKITEARLPIVPKAPENGPALYVGKAAVAAGLRLDDIDSPSREGLRLVSDGRTRILLGGQNDVATVKAACRFLEQLGCRYFMDNPLGEVYPRTRTLTAGRLDITEKPGFLMRKIWGSQWSGPTLWKVWNGDGGVPLSTQHAWGAYVDQSLFDTHPEYFALRDGVRKKGDWYCTSNPELRRIFAQGVIAKGGLNPSISPPDGTGYCQCNACRAQDDPDSIEPSSGMVNVTNRYVDFFDAVAKEVARAHPEWLLNFYCYADYTQPPTTGVKLPPNLVAWLAPIRYSRFHHIGSPNSPSTTQLAHVIDKWAAAARHLAYRTYNYNLAECLVPFSKLSIWAHDIPYLKSKGCLAINLESLANWEIYGPHMYQSIRLAYDPGADAKALMEDYFLKFYGPRAGALLKEYWLSIDRAFAAMKCASGSFYALHLVYTPAFLEKLGDLIRQATDAARDEPQYAARVAMTAEGLQNARQYMQIRAAMHTGDFAVAKRIYDDLRARNEAEVAKGYSNSYTPAYLNRFVGQHVAAGATATAAPNKVLQVLPDRMKLAYDKQDDGAEKGWHQPEFDDSAWREAATYGNTLNAQGLPDAKSILWYRTSLNVPTEHGQLRLFFTEVDGQAVAVYINGREVASLGKEAARKPFDVDVTAAVAPGRNVVALKVDHRRITELFLGGILRPILLIEKPSAK